MQMYFPKFRLILSHVHTAGRAARAYVLCGAGARVYYNHVMQAASYHHACQSARVCILCCIAIKCLPSANQETLFYIEQKLSKFTQLCNTSRICHANSDFKTQCELVVDIAEDEVLRGGRYRVGFHFAWARILSERLRVSH